MTKLALTGGTGHLGGLVAQTLESEKLNVRYLARRPEAVSRAKGVSVYKASYEHSPEVVEALAGVDVLFMVSASESATRLQEHQAFIDSAKEAGVGHIIYTSFYNANPNSTFTLSPTHAATEKYIKDRGFTYTFLRDNFYTDFFAELCQEYGEIKGPAGNGRVSLVVRADVAEVVAQILKDPEKWANRTLDMTGPEDLTLAEIAQIASEILGKEIAYVEETVEEAYTSRQAWPAEEWEYDAWVSTYTAIAKGEQAGVSDDIESVLGRKATSLETYLKNLI
ncbi:SDR family oxidoreductase [Streptococcus dentapri]|uniref:SDR family oxidoreductase n=1 Tax=Streptococcus dentapri TaxID=573564 RepID=A0ABV8CYS1_9STRE